MKQETTAAFERFYEIVVRLRSPEGCPWDREQTPSTLRSSLIEEVYELLDAIGNDDSENVKEELGDLYLLMTMIAFMYEQQEVFSVASVFSEVAEKLVRRHPHVFGDSSVSSAEDVVDRWEAIKRDVEGRSDDSLLASVPSSLPPLELAYRIQKKAAKKGFDWPDDSGVWEKVHEEIRELEDAIARRNTASMEAEIGDLLFTLVNLSRRLKVDPGIALAGANARFGRRFRFVEQRMADEGLTMSADSLDVMDAFWDESKAVESP